MKYKEDVKMFNEHLDVVRSLLFLITNDVDAINKNIYTCCIFILQFTQFNTQGSIRLSKMFCSDMCNVLWGTIYLDNLLQILLHIGSFENEYLLP